MSTLVNEKINRVEATGVRFVDDMLVLELNDARQVLLMHSVPAP